MDIYFNKNSANEQVYKEEQILAMNKQEVKNLKTLVQSAINDVAVKRDTFRTETELDKKSQEFFRKIYVYKIIIARYTKALAWLNTIEISAKGNQEHEDREHWLWCYYQESMKVLTEEMVDQIKEMADGRAKFHIEIEKWEYKGDSK